MLTKNCPVCCTEFSFEEEHLPKDIRRKRCCTVECARVNAIANSITKAVSKPTRFDV